MIIKLFCFLLDIGQLNLILYVTGYPSQKLLSQINEDARIYLENKTNKPTRVNFLDYFADIKSKTGNIFDNKIQK